MRGGTGVLVGPVGVLGPVLPPLRGLRPLARVEPAAWVVPLELATHLRAIEGRMIERRISNRNFARMRQDTTKLARQSNALQKGAQESSGSRTGLKAHICVIRALSVETSSVFLTLSATLTPSGETTWTCCLALY